LSSPLGHLWGYTPRCNVNRRIVGGLEHARVLFRTVGLGGNRYRAAMVAPGK
jgi:hypothetical protein